MRLFRRRRGDADFVDTRVVDDRVFLLGLDNLYRDAMKRHERGELLVAARCVAAALDVSPADVPVEGYYSEDERLTEYFRLARTLQEVDASRTDEVVGLPEFQRLRTVACAPIYGRPQYDVHLLPRGRDALSQALLDTRPAWSIGRLTAAAYASAHATDDISLAGLAARVRDAVVLAALRESVVLYEELQVRGCAQVSRPEYVWQVDPDLAAQARRFIDNFNALFDEDLPPPDANHANHYGQAFNDNEIVGRCAALGYDDVSPGRHYHWGIRHMAGGELGVQEFWQSEIWTTARYRSALSAGEYPRSIE